MASLDDFRKLPQYQGFSDEELITTLSNKYQVPLTDLARDFGVKHNAQRNPLSAGLSSGVDQLQGLGYAGLGAASRAVGLDSVANWADKGVRRNDAEAQFNGRPDLENIEDQSLSSAPGYLGYQVAKQVPMLVGTLAASAVVPEAAIPAALSRGLGYLPKAVGGGGLKAGMNFAERRAGLEAGNQFARIGAASYPMSAGSLYQEAVERGDPSQGDALAALAGGVPYAATEAVMPAAVARGLGVGGLGFKGGLGTRMLKAAGVEGLGEAGTELAQNEMEMGFAGPLTDEQKFSRRLNSAVAGGLVGGTFGSVAGIRRPPVVPNQTRDLLNDTPTDQFADYQRSFLGGLNVPEQAPAGMTPVDAYLFANQAGDRYAQTHDLLGDPLSYPVSFEQQTEAAPIRNRRQMDLGLEGNEAPPVLYGSGQTAAQFASLPITDDVRPTEAQQQEAAINQIKTVAGLKSFADQALAENRLTPDQHVEFFNTIDQNGRMNLAAKRTYLNQLIQENQNGTQTAPAGRQEGTQQAGFPQGAGLAREEGIQGGTPQGGGTVLQGRQGGVQEVNANQTTEAPVPALQEEAQPVAGVSEQAGVVNAAQPQQVAQETTQEGDEEAASEKLKQVIRSPKHRAIVYDALGLDAEGHAVNEPLRGEALAEKHGVSPARISQILKQYGLNAKKSDAMARVSSDISDEIADDLDAANAEDTTESGAAQAGLRTQKGKGAKSKVEASNDPKAGNAYTGQLKKAKANGSYQKTAAAWDKVSDTLFDDLGPGQKLWAIMQMRDAGKLTKIDAANITEGPKFSSSETTESSTTVDGVYKALSEWFFSKQKMGQIVSVVQHWDELPASVRNDERMARSANPETVQGFVLDGKVYLIADNIDKGSERSVFMHEVGAHIGLTEEEESDFANAVLSWKDMAEGSLERTVYDATMLRLKSAGESADNLSEIVAYATEEAVKAGATPTMVSKIGRWLKDLANAILRLISTKLAAGRPLTVQDLVDYTYGAAGIALDELGGKEGLSFSKKSTTEQIIEKLPVQMQEPVQVAADIASDYAQRAVSALSFTNELVDAQADDLPAARTFIDAINKKMVEMTRRKERVAKIAEAFTRLKTSAFDEAWTLGRDMRVKGAWAYQPTWLKREVKVDPEMAARWEKLQATNPEAAKLLDQAFQYGEETHADMRQVLEDELNEKYPGDDAKAKEMRDMMRRKLPAVDGPYLPLRRVGSHVFFGKSQAYMDAEANNDTKLMAELKQDEKHFNFKMFDSYAEAKAYKRQNEARYAESEAYTKKRFFNEVNSLPADAFEKIKQMASTMDGDAAKKVIALANELYLTSLAETSARKSELRASGAAGMDANDMFRAFVSKGSADAQYIAALKDGREISKAFGEMSVQADKAPNRDKATRVYNAIAERYAKTFEVDHSPVLERMMGLTSIWMLLTKPAYYLYNATQVALMTHPYLAQRFGATKSYGALWDAYLTYFKGNNILKPGAIDFSTLSESDQKLIEELTNRGKIDITLTQELGDLTNMGKGPIGKAVSKAGIMLRGAVQKGEMMNRVVSGLAAYHLAMKNGMSSAKATDYAAKVIDKTQADYTGFNAPALFNKNSLTRLMSQFRKFQVLQMTYLINSVREVSKGATPAEKWALSKMLRYTLAHHAILAGGLGLPLMNLVSFLFAASGDDDEPRDLELWLREGIDNETMGRLLTRGVPAALGVDISKNVGMAGATQVTGRDFDLTSRAGFEKTVFGLLGPAVGLGAQAAGAMETMGRGDYYKGLEQLAPGGIRTTMQALREAAQGQTNTKDDVLVTPDEINLAETAFKAMGFKLSSDAYRSLVRSKKYEFEQHFNDLGKLLKKEYTEAYRDGDSEAMGDVLERWQSMTESMRDYGFKPPKRESLLKAPMEQAKRERETANGVQFNKRSEGFVRQAAQ